MSYPYSEEELGILEKIVNSKVKRKDPIYNFLEEYNRPTEGLRRKISELINKEPRRWKRRNTDFVFSMLWKIFYAEHKEQLKKYQKDALERDRKNPKRWKKLQEKWRKNSQRWRDKHSKEMNADRNQRYAEDEEYRKTIASYNKKYKRKHRKRYNAAAKNAYRRDKHRGRKKAQIFRKNNPNYFKDIYKKTEKIERAEKREVKRKDFEIKFEKKKSELEGKVNVNYTEILDLITLGLGAKGKGWCSEDVHKKLGTTRRMMWVYWQYYKMPRQATQLPLDKMRDICEIIGLEHSIIEKIHDYKFLKDYLEQAAIYANQKV